LTSLYLGNASIVTVPANIEVVVCTKSLNNTSFGNTNRSTHQEEIINGFGLKIYKQKYVRPTTFYLNQISSNWLLFNPSAKMKKFRNDQIDNSVQLRNHDVILAFGSLISPYRFKCANSKFIYRSSSNLFFAKYHSCMSITMGSLRFTLRHDHIDSHRGIIINIISMSNVVIHITLRGNVEEYESQNRENGMLLVFIRKKTRVSCSLPSKCQ